MKREEYQNRRIIDLFAAKLHNSPIYYIALYRDFNTEKQKGKMKKINVTVADITFSNIKYIDNQLVTVIKIQMICKCKYKTI